MLKRKHILVSSLAINLKDLKDAILSNTDMTTNATNDDVASVKVNDGDVALDYDVFRKKFHIPSAWREKIEIL